MIPGNPFKGVNEAVPAVAIALACLVGITVILMDKIPFLAVLLLPVVMYTAGFLVVRLLAPGAVKKRILAYLSNNGGQADLNDLLTYLVPNANTDPQRAEPSVRVVASMVQDLERKGRVRVNDNRVFKVR